MARKVPLLSERPRLSPTNQRRFSTLVPANERRLPVVHPRRPQRANSRRLAADSGSYLSRSPSPSKRHSTPSVSVRVAFRLAALLLRSYIASVRSLTELENVPTSPPFASRPYRGAHHAPGLGLKLRGPFRSPRLCRTKRFPDAVLSTPVPDTPVLVAKRSGSHRPWRTPELGTAGSASHREWRTSPFSCGWLPSSLHA